MASTLTADALDTKETKPADPQARMTLREALNITPGVLDMVIDDTCPIGDALHRLLTLVGRTGHDRAKDKRSMNAALVAPLLKLLDSPIPKGVEPFRAGSALGADATCPPGTKDEFRYWHVGSGKLVVSPLAFDKERHPRAIQVGTSESAPVDLNKAG